jgi:nucleoside-diphosphate-sugar epimerase
MKLAQELLFEEFLAAPETRGAILRPGLVYDAQTLFAAHAGIFKGALRIGVAHGGDIPVIAAESLARAVLDAATGDLDGSVLQLVDDALPGLAQYREALQKRGALPATSVTLPWQLLAGLAGLLRGVCGAIGQSHRLPEVLQPHGFAARLKPFRYTNSRAKQLLGWAPRRAFG